MIPRLLPRTSLAGAMVCAALLSTFLSGCGRGSLDAAATDEIVLYGPTSRIRGIDPVKAGDVASSRAIGKIYEGLVQYDYLVRPYRVIPNLAESLPEVSEDGLTYTFKIRRGIYFADDPCFTETGGKGRELVAEDFVYSIKRIADVKNESSGYWAFNDRIVGLDAFREASSAPEPTDYDTPVEGLKALDAHTLRFTLTRPYPQLMWILTMHYAYAIPREAAEYYGNEFINHPVGTGPFRLKSWTRNYRIEFERNPKWEETGRVERYPSEGEPGDAELGLLGDAGRKLPIVDRIVQFVVGDSITQWLMFLTGQFESSGVSRDNFDAVITESQDLDEEMMAKGIRLFKTPTMTLYYIGFNMDDPVVGPNKKLRQAMTCAFNSEEWIEFWNHRVSRPTGPIPPGVSGYVDRPAKYPFNLDMAKELLAEAGYPDGQDPETGRRLQLTLELGNAESSETRQQAELFASFMEKIGIEITPSYNNWPTFLAKMDRRQAQMYSLGWVADYPDAENFLQLFYGDNSSPGPNHSNYANEEFDKLYEQARVMQDSPERTDLYQAMAEIVIEEAPWIFTTQFLSFGLHHKWIENYKPHDFPYGMEKYYKVDAAERLAWKKLYGE